MPDLGTQCLQRIWNTLSYVSMLIIEVIFHTCVVLFCMYRLHASLAIIPTIAMILSAFIAVSMERHLGLQTAARSSLGEMESCHR